MFFKIKIKMIVRSWF